MSTAEPTLAICGLDCGACTIFQARDHPEIAQRIANWFVQEMKAEVRPEQIRCAGCRGDRAEQWTEDCAIRACCEARGLTSCSECTDLPCARLVEWARGEERHSAALACLEELKGETMSNSDLVPWLLAAPTPSLRYLTLRRLMDRPKTDPEVQAAWQEMATAGPIPAILAGQTRAGNWAGERGYYTPKYVSTHWSMLLLTELAADGADPHLQRGAAFMLAATRDELDLFLARGRLGLSCFYGNLLRYVLHCGSAGDARVGAIIAYLARDAAGGWRCPINDELPCAWAAARALWGLAALPARYRSAPAEEAIASGLTFFLEGGHLVGGDYPARRVHKLWQRLNFPLFYQADVLFVLRILGELGALDHPGARPALEWLAGRRQANGHWRGASPYRRRTWDLGDHTETERWVSLQAAIVLRQSGRGAGDEKVV